MSKYELKSQVIELRKSGKRYREIQAMTGLSKGTIISWCKDMKLSPTEKVFFQDKVSINRKLGSLAGAQANRNKKITAQQDAVVWAKEFLGTLSKRDMLVCGVALYWAEGSKAETSTGFIFVNSDPAMILLMYRWLRYSMAIPKEDIVAKIAINRIHKERIGDVLNFWSNLLDLAPGSFSNTFFAKSTQKKVYQNNTQYYGVLRLSVKRSTLLKYRVLGLIGVLKMPV